VLAKGESKGDTSDTKGKAGGADIFLNWLAESDDNTTAAAGDGKATTAVSLAAVKG